MTWTDVLKIIAVVVSIAGTSYAAVRYVLGERTKQTRLAGEIEALRDRVRVLTTAIRQEIDQYQALEQISKNAEIAVGASFHSISVPVPPREPTHLQIVVSTDPEAKKILGKAFPISRGLAGRAFNRQVPEFVNRAVDDSRHYGVVDKAAGTRTGEGAILTYPLVSGGASLGVIQMMKSPGSLFGEEDVKVVGRFSDELASVLSKIRSSPQQDLRFGQGTEEFYTVCFTDINDFSQLSKALGLRQTVSLLDEYYRRLLETARAFNGAFEEYLGDGLYLSFHGTSKSAGAIAAVRCAIALQAEYENLRKEWSIYEYPVSKENFQNIGIASGSVFEGTVGHHLHRKRKLIGDAVNLAAHLVEAGKEAGRAILIDGVTRELLTGEDIQMEKVGRNPEHYSIRVSGQQSLPADAEDNAAEG